MLGSFSWALVTSLRFAPPEGGSPDNPGDASVESGETFAADTVLPESAPVSEQKQTKAIFSVVQTGDDGVLDQVSALLAKDPRITSVVSESGRWYATPDRDDLPEWFALRAYCSRDLIEQVMQETQERIRENLGPDAASEVSVSRYS